MDYAEPMNLSYELLKEITHDFSKDNFLGSGTYGVVYKGTNANGKEVAVKVLRDMVAFDDKEFQNLAKLDHQNILQLVGYCKESEQVVVEHEGRQVAAEKLHVALCFEYVNNGSLRNYISDEKEGLQWHIRYKIIKGICEGLKYLHEGNVLHLDLKPDNILLDKEMVPKIADFGLSRLIGYEKFTDDTRYLPPEYMKFLLISRKFDIYSLGVIITMIMMGRERYHDIADMPPRKLVKLVHTSWKNRLQETEGLRSQLEVYCQQVKTCIEVASKCLMENRRLRPNIQEVVATLKKNEVIYSMPSMQIQEVLKIMSSGSSVHHPDTTEGLVQALDPCTGRRGCMDTMDKMSYDSLKTITGNFSKDNVIGSGQFGVVYKGVLNGKEIAVKIFRDMAALDDKAFRNEFQNLARINHPNIVQLVGYCNESEKHTVEGDDGTKFIAEKMHVALCFQYIDNGSLHKHISDEYQGLEWHIRYKIIKGICEGLKYLRLGLDSQVQHLDLKPENILLDKEMVPKIADFGLSRLIGDDKTRQTINSVGTCGYWPPEYVNFQMVSKSFDIFSLGVIITKIMIGNEGYNSFVDMLPRKLVKHVHNNWKKRLKKTVNLTSLELEAYCEQVKTCIKMASKCLSEDRKQRPFIQDIVDALNKTEIMTPNIEKKVNHTYAIEKYSYELLRWMTDNFSEGRLLGKGGFGSVYQGIHEDGRKIAVKVLRYFSAFRPEQFEAEVKTVARFRHENIIQLIGYCCETEQSSILEHKGRFIFAERIHSAICFEYLKNGSLEQHISDENGLDWSTRYKILRGICDGLRYLHEELPTPIFHLDLKPSHILLDENMVPKIAGFNLSRCLQEGHTAVTSSINGTLGYMPPEFIDRSIISAKSDIYCLGVTIIYMLTGRQGYSDQIFSQEFIEDVLKNWRRRLQESLKGRSLEGYCQQVKKCIEIASQCVEGDRHKRPNIGAIVRMLDETETMIMVHDATKLVLDVQPMELRFPLKKPKRYASSLLRLHNKEDDPVAFRLVSKGQKVYHTNLPLLGIVPPRCTYTIALRMSNQQKRPRLDSDESLLLQSVAVSRHQFLDQASVVREFQSLFKKAQESDDDEAQEVTLKFVSSPPAEEEASSNSRPEIEIITALDAQEVSSIEVHPKEPWIMTTHERGNLHIWNYQTLAILNPIKLPQESVYVAKFIAREEWIVAGDSNGFIHVFSYDEYQDTTSFEAHNGQIMSLAVHPKDSSVLSSSHDDHLIKLWHWDKYWDFEKGPWVCTRTFEGHSNIVSHVIFNPDGTDSFTSASWDGTVKIWGSLNSDVCNTITLDTHPDGLLCVDYITDADRQHLITGLKDLTAQIWDLEIQRRREYLQGHTDHVSVVYYLPDHQKLITGSLDGTIRIWDSTTYRLENVVALNLGGVSDVGYIEEMQRIIVGCYQGIAVMEINFHELSIASKG